MFLVRWKGYDEGADTWEPLANLAHAPDVLADFYAAHPDAPRHIAAAQFCLSKDQFDAMPWRPTYSLTTPAPPPCAWEMVRHPEKRTIADNEF